MSNTNEQERKLHEVPSSQEQRPGETSGDGSQNQPMQEQGSQNIGEGSSGRQYERPKGARGTAAMDPGTRKEVARKGGLAVSRNRAHMADIGRKGGQTVSKNRDHMAQIGRKGGAASRGHGSGNTGNTGTSGSQGT